MSIMYGSTETISLGGTSPASAITVLNTSSLSLAHFNKAIVFARIQGGTGGTLDIYIQTSYDAGTTWCDIIHYTQLANGGAAVAWVSPVTRGGLGALAPVAVNTADGTPSLAANTVIPGALGDRLRSVFVAGASTSAGAAQTITVLLSSQ